MTLVLWNFLESISTTNENGCLDQLDLSTQKFIQFLNTLHPVGKSCILGISYLFTIKNLQCFQKKKKIEIKVGFNAIEIWIVIMREINEKNENINKFGMWTSCALVPFEPFGFWFWKIWKYSQVTGLLCEYIKDLQL